MMMIAKALVRASSLCLKKKFCRIHNHHHHGDDVVVDGDDDDQ